MMEDNDLRSTRINLEIRAQEIETRAQEVLDQLNACAQRLNDLIVILQAYYPQVTTLLPASPGSPTGGTGS
jgi:hypothetical protein